MGTTCCGPAAPPVAPPSGAPSAAPAATAGGKPELTYFDGPGRGELARLAFNLRGVEFVDTRVTFDEWPKLKSDATKAPAKAFGAMPVLACGDYLVAQSIAVAQYASDMSRTAANVPPTTQQRGLDMMILCAHADLQAALYGCLFGDDAKKAKGKEELPGKVKPLLEGIERQYKTNGPFVYSSKEAGPTLADLAIYNIVESPFPGLKALQIDTSSFTNITATVEAVKAALADGAEKPKPGPVKGPEASGKPELIYFQGPGRAELARLAFAAGGVEYTDTRYSFDQWPSVKQDLNSLPAKLFGSMPVVKHGDFHIAQSMAVSQYVADLGINVAKPPSDEQRGLDMMLLGAHAELQSAMYACLFGDDASKAKGKKALAGKVTPVLQGIERQFKAAGPYLYSPEAAGPTLGDLAVLDVVTSPFPGLKALGFDLAPFSKILRCVEACQKCSKGTLAAYLSARG